MQPIYHRIRINAQRTPDFKRLSAIFINGGDWYIAEYDGDDIFWGFVILNGYQINVE